MSQIIKYRGSFSWKNGTAQIKEFDIVNNIAQQPKLIEGSYEECLIAFGKMQYDYYRRYPRLLPKGISLLASDRVKSFQLNFRGLDDSTIHLGTFVTIQDAINAKKQFISQNIE